MSNCLVVQHVAPEPAFTIADALRDAGVEVDIRRVFAADQLPSDISDVDGLVVMGGPMSAASDVDFPTRRTEIALIGDALASGIPIFGVCLGAQLLAAAGGARVVKGASGPEIGWAPVELSPACSDDRLFKGLPRTLTVLHWHGETFDLPVGAQHLIGNDAYTNQGFRIGEVAWGVQFHLEVTQASVEGFVTAFASDAEEAVGGASAIRSQTPGAISALASPRDLIFERFAGLVAARVRAADPVDSV